MRRKRVRSSPKKRLIRFTNADNPVVSVIIPIYNERRTLAAVLQQAFRVHPLTEVLVIANGSTDGSIDIARRMGARVFAYPRKFGHDVGRSVGANVARGSILLFTDGDIVIPATKMKPLIKAVEQGVDVALNAYIGPTKKLQVHRVVLAKHALNYLLGRPELKGSSMTAIPHAISRKALEEIGAEALSIPPKAQAIAIHKGLRIERVNRINVGVKNPRRRRSNGADPLTNIIVGDHIEALHWVIEQP
ncbi:glycosyltransferase [Paenibacillus sp. N1-5-1-14]|uniref:glycosyltransferase family 2 protein n=1 Tax=Paenibacillus radicibacter TaxID=2972488 RepID=UPI0021594514|nr:glycosyltransferase family 2 protein [Paenibacillus radicibacter]MCR8645183.1 glycosyltransferase [Paenibacillus radicibacter]